MASAKRNPEHLIQTKFYPPRAPERLVSRQYLLDQLSRGHIPAVILISAPAGYGKSTLAHQWLEVENAPYAWISLDEHDKGLDIILRYLIAALEQVYPSLGRETHKLLRQPQLPRPQRLADSLIRDLKGLSEPVFVAFDDFHAVSEPDLHDFMTRLVQYLPAELHLILITRSDPPLALSRMRGRREVREIRAIDLRFTTEDTALFLEEIIGRSVSDEVAALLADRTEGWAVGLRMAALSLRDSPDVQAFLERYAQGGQKLVFDYLLSEVLGQLSDEDYDLLLKTAVVDRFSPPLVNALAGLSPESPSGGSFIEMMWSSNLFLIALDDQGSWFRHHHLFRQLLQQRLGKAFSETEIAALHKKAGTWFEEAGLIEDAILHYVDSGDVDGAGKLIEHHFHWAMDQEEWRLLDQWVHLLPAASRNRPGLLAIQAMLDQLGLRIRSISSLLNAAEQGLKSGGYDYTAQEETFWQGVIALYRGVVLDGETTPQEALNNTGKALQRLDESAIFVRGMAELFHILALQQSGNYVAALEFARDILQRQAGPPDVRTDRLMLGLSAVYHCQADVSNLHNQAKKNLDIAHRTGRQISLSWVNFYLGWSAYQENKLEEAAVYFKAVVENCFMAHVRCAVDSFTGLALCQANGGQLVEAQQTVEMLRDFLVEQNAFTMLTVANSLGVRINQEWDSWSSAPEWVHDYKNIMAVDHWEQPVFTTCRMTVELGGGDKLALARRTLEGCRAFALSRNNIRQLLQAGALEALLLEAQGERKRAVEALQTAVTIGEAGGALRIFADLGPALIPLFGELLEQGISVEYVRRILEAYGDTVEGEGAAAQRRDGAPGGLSREALDIMTELTNREMDVLVLLGQRLTNKEIADRLHISPHTVKKYTLDIYSKLDVDGRRQAVARARELGILNS